MPCTISKAEQEHYERLRSEERYGVSLTNREVITAVACEACALLKAGQPYASGSKMLRQWHADHLKYDAEKEKRNAAQRK